MERKSALVYAGFALLGFVLAAILLRGGQGPALGTVAPHDALPPFQLASSDDARALRTEVAMLRRALVSIYCELRGVGPSGGFCLDAKNAGHSGGNDILPRELAEQLAVLFSGARVVNLGAGIGHYELFWATLPAGLPRPASVRSCDGAENIGEFALRDPASGTPLVTYCTPHDLPTLKNPHHHFRKRVGWGRTGDNTLLPGRSEEEKKKKEKRLQCRS